VRFASKQAPQPFSGQLVRINQKNFNTLHESS
jgi:hypothetical protein